MYDTENIMSEEARKIVNEIDNFTSTNFIKLEEQSEYIFVNEVNTIINNIDRIKKEFESEIFFIVASGGLKSGKSTLINLLAHKEISTTAQGKETTLRPSIVTSGDEDKILIFISTLDGLDDKDKKILLDNSIDYIKTFLTEEELNAKHIKVMKKDISSANLTKYLTKKQLIGEDEPLLINIQIAKENLKQYQYSLLNKNIAFIDTPGIDGITASVEGLKDKDINKANKHWLIDRVDLMLFLQSSVTPINSDGQEYIKSLIESCKEPSLRLVHNKFTLKPWREKYGIETSSDMDNNAIVNALNLFKNITGKDIKPNTVDFAKAIDGYKYGKNELIEESGFEDFEEALYRDIMDNKAQYKEKKTKNRLNQLIKYNLNSSLQENDETTIFSCREKIKKLEKKWEDEKDNYLKILKELEEFFSSTERVENHINEPFNKKEQMVDDGWAISFSKKKLKQYSPKLRNLSDLTKEELENQLEKLKKKIYINIKNEFENNGLFVNYILKSKNSEESPTIEELILRFNKLNNKIVLKKFDFNYEYDFNQLDVTADKIYKRDFVKKVTSFFKDKVGDDAAKIENNLEEEYQTYIEQEINSFHNDLKQQISNRFTEYGKDIKLAEKAVENYFNKKYHKEKEHIEKTEEKLSSIEDFLKKLDMFHI